MNPIKVLIVDDETHARAVIRNYLSAYDEFEIIGECENGFEAVKAIQEQNPHLVFLDIQMPKINGFELLELLDAKPVIVFSTAHDQYALKAFEASAADYLLKPYSRARFDAALKRARLFLQDRSLYEPVLQKLAQHGEQATEFLRRIVVKTGAQIHIVPVAKLIWIEAQDDYVMLHTAENTFLKQKTMKFYEQHLPPDEFVRIHRSHIVKISAIRKLEVLAKDAHRAVLTNGRRLPVSKSGHARLKALLG